MAPAKSAVILLNATVSPKALDGRERLAFDRPVVRNGDHKVLSRFDGRKVLGGAINLHRARRHLLFMAEPAMRVTVSYSPSCPEPDRDGTDLTSQVVPLTPP